MRVISFALTTKQFLDGTKDVTRRLGWDRLKSGDPLRVVRKSMGLKAGEVMEVLGFIRAVDVRREPLNQICADLEYGYREMIREGFPPPHELCDPANFLDWFCTTHTGCFPSRPITRIEFVRIEAP